VDQLRGARARKLFLENDLLEKPDTSAAVLLRPVNAAPAALVERGLPPPTVAHDVVEALMLARAECTLGFAELEPTANLAAEALLLRRVREIHQDVRTRILRTPRRPACSNAASTSSSL